MRPLLLLHALAIIAFAARFHFHLAPGGRLGFAFVAQAIVPNRYAAPFRSLRGTRWARFDTRLYSPLFLLLGLLLIVQAMEL